MSEKVKAFFSQLHADYLKPWGFRKQRHTFTRDLVGYSEVVQFQGSSFNLAILPWRFYVNFGIRFHDLSPRSPDRDLPGTHCWTRIRAILPDAPAYFDLGTDDAGFVGGIANLVQDASKRVALEIDSLRRLYREGRATLFTLG
jgi:hypothetical protein